MQAWSRTSTPGLASRIDYIFVNKCIAACDTLRTGISNGAEVWCESDHSLVLLDVGWRRVMGLSKKLQPPIDERRWIKLFSNVDFKKDWKHTLQKEKWVRNQVDFQVKLKRCLTEVEPLSSSEAHAIVDPLGATFLEAMTASLHETWDS
jgi:hypothetical protein